MRKWFWCVTLMVFFLSATIISWRSPGVSKSGGGVNTSLSAKELFNQYVNSLYQVANLQGSGLGFDVFEKAVTGYTNLKLAHKIPQNSTIITVVDFTKSSREKRMWIIDLFSKQLLLNTWVAHGQGSGMEMADHFSDRNDSHQSSVGFFLADNVYIGKHGRSLRLDGMDPGFNTSARARGIVVHAADYVSQNTIDQMGRLGRSFGCPAVSPEVSDFVINTLQGKSVFFINGNVENYTSQYLDETGPINQMAADSTSFDVARL
ncbi:MAG TPA: murein L,D-transpeptidase catalytic domain family protein [Mucilaginibacter sp.]